MKYKIKEVGEDANKYITIRVEYSDGDKKEEKTFNFNPMEKTKVEILEAIDNGNPIVEKTPEEIAKETVYKERKAELDLEVDKEVEIKEIKE